MRKPEQSRKSVRVYVVARFSGHQVRGVTDAQNMVGQSSAGFAPGSAA